MHRKPRTFELTPRQIAGTLTALRSHAAALSEQEDEDPQADEVHDILTAESAIKTMVRAGAEADQADCPATRLPQ
jgi:hypothetical protein